VLANVALLGPTVPHVTLAAPVQANVNDSDPLPVFCTVKTAVYPPVFGTLVGAAPPSGVTATPKL